MIDPKLSIIVPVYNVADFLLECVKSILKQPFQNFEILLIDDGSKDVSGTICDELSDVDDRIQVFHKVNGGLSSARNYGIGKSRGEYITFIDSDDYLSGDYYTEGIEQLDKCPELDMVWLRYANVYDDGRIDLKQNETVKLSKADNPKLFLRYLIQNEAYAWLKIYRKSKFSNICYPEGQILEDAFIIPDLFYNFNSIQVLKTGGYYCYRQRAGSICHTVHTSRMILDIAKAEARKLEICQAIDRDLFMKQIATFSSSYLNVLILTKEIDKDLDDIYNQFEYTIVEILKTDISCSQKIKLFLLKLYGYRNLARIYKYIYRLKH